MKGLTKLRSNLKTGFSDFDEYRDCIQELIINEKLYVMEKYIHHKHITCLEHSFSVSYTSFILCRRLGLDFRSAARGGLLHDFFLYDWHTTKPEKGLHGFTHPSAALENAGKYFILNDVEKDIIVKHMWPLTVKLPRYTESFVVAFADKYCALFEIIIPRSAIARKDCLKTLMITNHN
ncbi:MULTISPECIES: HD domain-containing protein [Dehalobacter]|uniref:HD family phosphohydrolase n=2 Tax=Dehalobacter restrictus TaxID=55583 RepID=A0ABN4BRB2_DEHRP|nr:MULTISPECIES: HD domain-containing protein [Dehalobacter]AHF09919.1 HD family phosphohydrolase [Dehalobacter restrictus DSM 9455]MDJ0304587.1 HD family phosphohydrolase [Dehalobacter sp.]OCZ53260.1 HD family phosphohydrolase [Dehalobacter sp. TeCB1]